MKGAIYAILSHYQPIIMESLNGLENIIDFEPGENGLCYKNIDNFVYTFYTKKKNPVLCVNLPTVSKNEKGMISCYIKESISYVEKLTFIREGAIILFSEKILDEPEYILKFAQQLSAFLSSAGIEFSNPELNIAISKNKKMYIFDSVERPLSLNNFAFEMGSEEMDSEDDVLPLDPITDSIFFIDNQSEDLDDDYEDLKDIPKGFKGFLLINNYVIYILFAIVFFVLSVLCPKIAAATGYLLGWAAASVYVWFEDNFAMLRAIIYSFLTILVATFAFFLFSFLSQTELYTLYDFVHQSLTLQYSLFNLVLGTLLAFFGIYSTVPSKKKLQNQGQDF